MSKFVRRPPVSFPSAVSPRPSSSARAEPCRLLVLSHRRRRLLSDSRKSSSFLFFLDGQICGSSECLHCFSPPHCASRCASESPSGSSPSLSSGRVSGSAASSLSSRSFSSSSFVSASVASSSLCSRISALPGTKPASRASQKSVSEPDPRCSLPQRARRGRRDPRKKETTRRAKRCSEILVAPPKPSSQQRSNSEETGARDSFPWIRFLPRFNRSPDKPFPSASCSCPDAASSAPSSSSSFRTYLPSPSPPSVDRLRRVPDPRDKRPVRRSVANWKRAFSSLLSLLSLLCLFVFLPSTPASRRLSPGLLSPAQALSPFLEPRGGGTPASAPTAVAKPANGEKGDTLPAVHMSPSLETERQRNEAGSTAGGQEGGGEQVGEGTEREGSKSGGEESKTDAQGQESLFRLDAKPSKETRDTSFSVEAMAKDPSPLFSSFSADEGDSEEEENEGYEREQARGLKEGEGSVEKRRRTASGGKAGGEGFSSMDDQTWGTTEDRQKKREEKGDSDVNIDSEREIERSGDGDGNSTSSSSASPDTNRNRPVLQGKNGAPKFSGLRETVDNDEEAAVHAADANGATPHEWRTAEAKEEVSAQGEAEKETAKETEKSRENETEKGNRKEGEGWEARRDASALPPEEHQQNPRESGEAWADGADVSEASLKRNEQHKETEGATSKDASSQRKNESSCSACSMEESCENRRKNRSQDAGQTSKQTTCEAVDTSSSFLSFPSSPSSSCSSSSSPSSALSSSPFTSPCSNPFPSSPSSSFPFSSSFSPSSRSSLSPMRDTVLENETLKRVSPSSLPPSPSFSAASYESANACPLSFDASLSLSFPRFSSEAAVSLRTPGEARDRLQASGRQSGEEGRDEGRGERRMFSRALGLISSLTNLLSPGRLLVSSPPFPGAPAALPSQGEVSAAPSPSLAPLAPVSSRLFSCSRLAGERFCEVSPSEGTDKVWLSESRPGSVSRSDSIGRASPESDHQTAKTYLLGSSLCCLSPHHSEASVAAGVCDSRKASAVYPFLPSCSLRTSTELESCTGEAEKRLSFACVAPLSCPSVLPHSPCVSSRHTENSERGCPAFSELGGEILFSPASACPAVSGERTAEARNLATEHDAERSRCSPGGAWMPCTSRGDSAARAGQTVTPGKVQGESKGLANCAGRNSSLHAEAKLSPAAGGECPGHGHDSSVFSSTCLREKSQEIPMSQMRDMDGHAETRPSDTNPQRALECADAGEREVERREERKPSSEGDNNFQDPSPGGSDTAPASRLPFSEEQGREDSPDRRGEDSDEDFGRSEGKGETESDDDKLSLPGASGAVDSQTGNRFFSDEKAKNEGASDREKKRSFRDLLSPPAVVLRRFFLPLSLRRLFLAPLVKAFKRREAHPLLFSFSRDLCAGENANLSDSACDAASQRRGRKEASDERNEPVQPRPRHVETDSEDEANKESSGSPAPLQRPPGESGSFTQQQQETLSASLPVRSSSKEVPEAVPVSSGPSRPRKTAEFTLNGRPFLRGRRYEAEAQKLKFDFASVDAGARVVASSRGVANIKALQRNDLDSYMLVPCELHPKFFVLSFTEPIHVEQVALASMEIYASAFRHIQLLGSDAYPTKQWRLLANLETTASEAHEIFDVKRECSALHEGQACWAKYLKVRLLSHHLDSPYYYCSLTSFQVFGSTGFQMLESHIHSESAPETDSGQSDGDAAAEAKEDGPETTQGSGPESGQHQGGDERTKGGEGDGSDATASGEGGGDEWREEGGNFVSSSGEKNARAAEAAGKAGGENQARRNETGTGGGADEAREEKATEEAHLPERSHGDQERGDERTREDEEERKTRHGEEKTNSDDLNKERSAAFNGRGRDGVPTSPHRQTGTDEEDEVEEEKTARDWREQVSRERANDASVSPDLTDSAEILPSPSTSPIAAVPSTEEKGETLAAEKTTEAYVCGGVHAGAYLCDQGERKSGEKEPSRLRSPEDVEGEVTRVTEQRRSEEKGKSWTASPSRGEARGMTPEHKREDDRDPRERRDKSEGNGNSNQEEDENIERKRPPSAGLASAEEEERVSPGAFRASTKSPSSPSSSSAPDSPAGAGGVQQEERRDQATPSDSVHAGRDEKKGDGRRQETDAAGRSGGDAHWGAESHRVRTAAEEEALEERTTVEKRRHGEKQVERRGSETREECVSSEQVQSEGGGLNDAVKTKQDLVSCFSNCEEDRDSRPRAKRTPEGGAEGPYVKSESQRGDEGGPSSRKKPRSASLFPEKVPREGDAEETEREQGLLRQLHQWRGLARLPLLFSPPHGFPLGGATAGDPAGGASLLRSVINFLFPSWDPDAGSRSPSVVFEPLTVSPSFSVFAPSFSRLSPLKRSEARPDEEDGIRRSGQGGFEGGDNRGENETQRISPEVPGAASRQSPGRLPAKAPTEGESEEELSEGASPSPNGRIEAAAKAAREAEDEGVKPCGENEGVKLCEDGEKGEKPARGGSSPSPQTTRVAPPRASSVSSDSQDPRLRLAGPFPGVARLFSRRRWTPSSPPGGRLPRALSPLRTSQERQSTVRPHAASASPSYSSAPPTFPAAFPFPALLPQNTILEDLLAWAERGGQSLSVAGRENAVAEAGGGETVEGSASFLAASSLSPILPLLAQRRKGEGPAGKEGAKALAPVVAATFPSGRNAGAKLPSETDGDRLATRGNALSQMQQQDLLHLLLQNLPAAAATASASLFPSGFPAAQVVENLAGDLSAVPAVASSVQSRPAASGSVSSSSAAGSAKGGAKGSAASASQTGDRTNSAAPPASAKESAAASTVSSKGSGHVLLTLVDRMKAAESQGAQLREKLSEVALSLHSNQQQTLQQVVLLQLLLELVSFLYMRLSKFDAIVPRLPFLLDFADSGAAAAASLAAKRTAALKRVSSASGSVVGDGDTPTGLAADAERSGCSGSDLSPLRKAPGLDTNLSFKGEGASDGGDFITSVASFFAGGREETAAGLASCCRRTPRTGTHALSPKECDGPARKEGASCGGSGEGGESGADNSCESLDAQAEVKDCSGFGEAEGGGTFEGEKESFLATVLRLITHHVVTVFSSVAYLTEEACFVIVSPLVDGLAASVSTPQTTSTSNSQGRRFCLHATETVAGFFSAVATLQQSVLSSLIECWREAVKWKQAGGVSPGAAPSAEKGPSWLSVFLLLLLLHMAYGVFILRFFSRKTSEAVTRAEAAVRECRDLRLSLEFLLRAPTERVGFLGRWPTLDEIEMESSARALSAEDTARLEPSEGAPASFSREENGEAEPTVLSGERRDAEAKTGTLGAGARSEDRAHGKKDTLASLASPHQRQYDGPHVSRSQPVTDREEYVGGYERFRLASLALQRDTMKWGRHRNDGTEQGRRQSFDLSSDARDSTRSSRLHPSWQERGKPVFPSLKSISTSQSLEMEKDPLQPCDLRTCRATARPPERSPHLAGDVPSEPLGEFNLTPRPSSAPSNGGVSPSSGVSGGGAPMKATDESDSRVSKTLHGRIDGPFPEETNGEKAWGEDGTDGQLVMPSDVKSDHGASSSPKETLTASVHSSVSLSPYRGFGRQRTSDGGGSASEATGSTPAHVASPVPPFLKHKKRTNTCGNLDGNRHSGGELQRGLSSAAGSRRGDRGADRAGKEGTKGEEEKAPQRKSYNGQSHGNRRAFKLQRHTVKGVSGGPSGSVTTLGARRHPLVALKETPVKDARAGTVSVGPGSGAAPRDEADKRGAPRVEEAAGMLPAN
ncbi:Sad1 / UNC family C-terminal protein [Toxoplasma gondii RUB]|uniref:Sad1 / UNC family C-terminal protein n=1 Tax=Toxoplasma gondii RUB TaxID=935652 RepID=A0A086LKM9_TOXGO|nr:Sad1 / UNC family C-terminal protein [Toxoplasma gondii RUB]